MFLTLLFGLIFYIFRNAFSINFLADDYFFLKIGRAQTFSDFLNFFSPEKNYFYRPLATEVFYWFIHLIRENVFLSHLLVFSVYCLGIYFVYRSLLTITRDKLLSKVVVFIYSISFIHVFQLYYFGTFQEVMMFAFMAGSFFYFLKGRPVISLLFFVASLLSKETAIFFPVFVIVYQLLKTLNEKKPMSWKRLVPYFVIGIVFAILYRSGLKSTMTLDNYKLNVSPRMAANNVAWYFLWSIGLPNYMPDYMTSLFKPPIKEFWKVFRNFPETKIYFTLLASCTITFLAGLATYLFKEKKRLKEILLTGSFFFVGFLIFVVPLALFSHKWMVRLTVPLIFVSFFQGYLLTLFYKKNGGFRKLFYFILTIYFFLNLVGVKIHESSSTFFLESRISDHLKSEVTINKKEMQTKKFIYFQDVMLKDYNPWGQSKHLKTTLGDQNFIDLYFPGTKIKAVYGFENKNMPPDSYVINSLDLLKP